MRHVFKEQAYTGCVSVGASEYENRIGRQLVSFVHTQFTYPYLYGINVCIIMQTDSFLIPLVWFLSLLLSCSLCKTEHFEALCSSSFGHTEYLCALVCYGDRERARAKGNSNWGDSSSKQDTDSTDSALTTIYVLAQRFNLKVHT